MDPVTWTAIAAGASTVFGLAGTAAQYRGNKQAAAAAEAAAKRQQTAANFEATQMTQLAGQEAAAAQREAATERKRAELLASRAIAINAAGGGSSSDPAVLELLADIGSEGAYRAGVALYQGEERGRQLRMGSDAKVYEGAAARAGGKERASAYSTAATGSLFSGASTMFQRYGMGGPSSAPKKSAANSWFETSTPDPAWGEFD